MMLSSQRERELLDTVITVESCNNEGESQKLFHPLLYYVPLFQTSVRWVIVPCLAVIERGVVLKK